MIQYYDDGDLAVFEGYTFRRDKKTGYYLSSKKIKNGKRVRLHVYVWEISNNQTVPEGFEIHHKDFNKYNNEPENLVALSPEEHAEIHKKAMTEEQKRELARRLEEKARPKALEWHGSKEGREWHKKHAIEIAEKYKKGSEAWENIAVEYVCDFCGKTFKTKRNAHKNHFCSNKCKTSYRRSLHLDDIEKICQKCGDVFIDDKYSVRKYCMNCSPKLKRIRKE